MELKKVVALPKEIPPGKYTVSADAVDVAGGEVTCLMGSVVFRGRG